MILLLAAVFILPVILAKLALENGWFNQAATNKGELLSPPIDMSVLQISTQQPKWKLLYILPEICALECENAHENSNIEQLALLKDKQNIRLFNTNLKSLQQVFKENITDGIFIADTLDNVILRYPLQIDQEQAILHSRDILADMRKVLKLSRIG